MALTANRLAVKKVKRRLAKMVEFDRGQVKNKIKGEFQRVVSERDIEINEQTIHDEVEAILDRFPNFRSALGDEEIESIVADIVTDIVKYGPIQGLLDDDSVTEIMVNGHASTFIERRGVCQRADVFFDSDDDVEALIDRIAAEVGRVCNDQFPQLDARLADGSRVHATKRGATPSGPTITIRKFSPTVRDIDAYVAGGSCSREMGEFLLAAVAAKSNILVTGGTGAGKTSLLNALSTAIPHTERVITIEDNKELMLDHENWVAMEGRPANSEGAGRITIRDLVIGSLRMRPDRIVVGECRGAEAFDMLQAMNTGHDGSLTTIHANDARAGLTRLESMVVQSGEISDPKSIVQMIQSAIDIIVHIKRLSDGRRVISQIEEVDGSGGNIVKTQLVFKYDEVDGVFSPSGFPPARTVERFRSHNVDYDPAWFRANRLTTSI